MANIKSAKKRILVTKVRTERNKAIKSKVRTSIKKVYAAIAAGGKEEAVVALRNSVSEMKKATTKGVYHKNTTSRKIARLSKAVDKMA